MLTSQYIATHPTRKGTSRLRFKNLAFTAFVYKKDSIGPVRFDRVLKPPNPELDLGFGSVHDPPPNLNSGPVRVRFSLSGSESVQNRTPATLLFPQFGQPVQLEE